MSVIILIQTFPGKVMKVEDRLQQTEENIRRKGKESASAENSEKVQEESSFLSPLSETSLMAPTQ